MWISAMMLVVTTQDSPDAGTDNRITAAIRRDGQTLMMLALDWPEEDDMERGAERAYTYFDLPRHNDKTPSLPPDIGQDPMPYPDRGLEFSFGLPGHLTVMLATGGKDLWLKERVQLFIRQSRLKPTSFDTLAWREDASWARVADWDNPAKISKDQKEGKPTWTMAA